MKDSIGYTKCTIDRGVKMKKEKILVWGTGVSAANLFNKYLTPEDVFCYIDNDKERCGQYFFGKPIIYPSEIIKIDYELILIASTSSQDIYQQCLDLGLNMDYVFFVYRDFEQLKKITSEIASKNAEYILGRKWMECFDYHFRVITENIYYRQKHCVDELENTWLKQRDYVRAQTLELLANEIYTNNIGGDVAEFGVYKGEFSHYIRSIFHGKELYMFDTFDGFREEENEKEVALGRCNDSFSEAFKQTSENFVKGIFCEDEVENIHIVQGLFPESLQKYPNLKNQKFAFVSLDFDYEDSIFEGLKYAYPRLEKGGYIMLHDYNSKLTGVKKGVERYEQEIKKMICKVPICDEYGTLIIAK